MKVEAAAPSPLSSYHTFESLYLVIVQPEGRDRQAADNREKRLKAADPFPKY